MKKITTFEVEGRQFTSAKEAKHYAKLCELRAFVVNVFIPEASVSDIEPDFYQRILDKWKEISAKKKTAAGDPANEDSELPPAYHTV